MITRKDFEHIAQLQANSTKTGMADDENRLKEQEGEKERKLRELLQGQAQQSKIAEDARQQQAIQNNFARSEAAARQAGLKPGKYSVAASANSMGYNPESENPLAMIGLMERKQARDDKDLVTYGNRIEKAGIPQAQSAFANLEQGTAKDGNGGILSNPKYEPKFTGPVANTVRSLPGGQLALNIGEKLGLMPKGSQDEQALVQRLLNIDTRNFSGSAVSAHEQGRQNIEKGMSAGGDPNLIKMGIKQMQDAVSSETNNINASTRPEVRNVYKQQGGKVSLEEFLGKPMQQQQMQSPSGADPEMDEYLRLKAKHRK